MTEERIGRLVVSSRAPEHEGGYRAPASSAILELTRGEKSLSPRPAMAVVFAALLGAGLLVFAVLVHSGPGIGAASIALAAMAWLVFSGSRRWPSGRIRVRIEPTEVCVEGAQEPLRVPIDRIEAFGVGLDAPPLHTLFVRVRDRGRVLLLDGLTRDEAALAERWLREAIGS